VRAAAALSQKPEVPIVANSFAPGAVVSDELTLTITFHLKKSIDFTDAHR